MADQKRNQAPETLDDVWFSELLLIKIKYNKLLSPDFVSIIKRGSWGQFLTADILPFTFSELEKEDIGVTTEKIQQLWQRITDDDAASPVLKKLWLAKLAGMKEQVALLADMQALIRNMATAPRVDTVQSKMEAVMGEPKTELFALTMAELRLRLQARNKEDLLSELGLDTFVHCLPAYESFSATYPRIDFLPVTVIDQSSIDSVPELKLYMEQALHDMGLNDSWVVKIDKTQKYHRVQVSYKKRRIIIPSVESYNLNGKKYVVTANKAFRLMVHEIGTHALRSSSGYASPLKLLSVGLHGYLLGEEGIATFREQQYLGTKTYFEGFQSYLAICLAYGLDQNYKKRSPYELYDILYKINIALFYKNDTFAQYSAWKRILRTYITVPHLSATIINTKDLVYREGNIRIHQLYATGEYNDDKINVGVYDPCNEEHVSDLRSLGIL